MKIPDAAQELLKEQGISVKPQGKIPDDVRALLQSTGRDGKATTFRRAEGSTGGSFINRAAFHEESERALQKELIRSGMIPKPMEQTGDAALLDKLRAALGDEAYSKLMGALVDTPVIQPTLEPIPPPVYDVPDLKRDQAIVSDGANKCSCGQVLGSDFLFCPACGTKQQAQQPVPESQDENYPITPENLLFSLLAGMGETPSISVLNQVLSLIKQVDPGVVPTMGPGGWGVEWEDGVPSLVAPDGELLSSEEEIEGYQKFSEKFSRFS